jgi:hypothetical protein
MFQLIFGDHDLALKLQFDTEVEDQLIRLVSRDVEANADQEAPSRSDLAEKIVKAITRIVDPATAAPTEKQIKYALGISRELGLRLPADCLKDRAAIAAFLDAHANTYRAQQRKSRVQGSVAKRS